MRFWLETGVYIKWKYKLGILVENKVSMITFSLNNAGKSNSVMKDLMETIIFWYFQKKYRRK